METKLSKGYGENFELETHVQAWDIPLLPTIKCTNCQLLNGFYTDKAHEIGRAHAGKAKHLVLVERVQQTWFFGQD